MVPYPIKYKMAKMAIKKHGSKLSPTTKAAYFGAKNLEHDANYTIICDDHGYVRATLWFNTSDRGTHCISVVYNENGVTKQ